MYVTHTYTHMATVLHISADTFYIVVYINKLLIMSFTWKMLIMECPGIVKILDLLYECINMYSSGIWIYFIY